jgi:hypothetical protein
MMLIYFSVIHDSRVFSASSGAVTLNVIDESPEFER